jgi:tetratricopeptide (TPR) repeat protein
MAGQRPARRRRRLRRGEPAGRRLPAHRGRVRPGRQARYRLHDLLRDYAAEQLADQPAAERHAAQDRLTSGWLQLAALANARLPNEPYFPPPAPAPLPAVVPESLARDITADPIAWFTTERLSLLATVTRCCATGRHQPAAQIATSMANFQYLQGRLDDAERVWQAITSAAQHADDQAATAHAQLRLTAALCGQGRHAEAGPMLAQCTRAFSRLGDNAALANAYYWRAVCNLNLGSYIEVLEPAKQAMQLAKASGNRQAEILTLRLEALAQANLHGRGMDAVTSAEQALALATELSEAALEFEVLHALAHAYNLSGRHEDALRLSQLGMDMARHLGAQAAIAGWLGIRADAHRGLGRYREAAESLTAALPIFGGHFMRRHQGLCLLRMGHTYQAMGDHQTAARYLTESMTIFSQLQLDHYTERAREALNGSHVGDLPPSAGRSQMAIQSGDGPEADLPGAITADR